jgi:hypothetical protein
MSRVGEWACLYGMDWGFGRGNDAVTNVTMDAQETGVSPSYTGCLLSSVGQKPIHCQAQQSHKNENAVLA